MRTCRKPSEHLFSNSWSISYTDLCVNLKILEFVFYVKTDVSPLSKCMSKICDSCASHILSFCFISVSGFIEISHRFLVIEQMQTCMENDQREITSKIHKQGL